MKKLLVVPALALIALFSFPALAACPTTNCSTDCGGPGRSCVILQWETGPNGPFVCSVTTCYGRSLAPAEQ